MTEQPPQNQISLNEIIQKADMHALGIKSFDELLKEKGFEHISFYQVFIRDFYESLEELDEHSKLLLSKSLAICIGGINRSKYLKTTLGVLNISTAEGLQDPNIEAIGMSIGSLCDMLRKPGNFIANNEYLIIKDKEIKFDTLLISVDVYGASAISSLISLLIRLAENTPDLRRINLKIVLVLGTEREAAGLMSRIIQNNMPPVDH